MKHPPVHLANHHQTCGSLPLFTWCDQLSLEPPAEPKHTTQITMWGSAERTFHPEESATLSYYEFQSGRKTVSPQNTHSACLTVCLNFSGVCIVGSGRNRHALENGSVGLGVFGNQNLTATRSSAEKHSYLLLSVGHRYLRAHLGRQIEALKPLAQAFVRNPETSSEGFETSEIAPSLLSMVTELRHPQVPAAAFAGWYRSKILQILVQTVFAIGPKLENRTQRKRRGMVERIRELVDHDLANPPSLDELAREIGASPFHVSRTFVGQMGMTIPAYLRTKRIAWAAELLAQGRLKAGEVAARVGYRSLTAFRVAFVEVTGHTPGSYPPGTLCEPTSEASPR